MDDRHAIGADDGAPSLLACGDRLCLDGVDLPGLAERYGTPLYVYSERTIRTTIHAVRTAFERRHGATRVCFASKACSNLWVLHVVRACGIDVEVNAGGELHKALRAGFRPDQVVFNGVAKTRDEIERAVAGGVSAFIVDSLCELARIGEVATALQRPAAVAPRVDVQVPALTHPGLETAHGGKAGIDRYEAADAFRLAAAHPWLEAVGLHMHLGSQIASLEPYRQAMHAALDLIAEMEAACGARLAFLDAGGGFAVPYAGDKAGGGAAYFASPLAFDDYAGVICGELRARRPDLTLLIEPGRSLLASAGVLLARVEAAKTKGLRDAAGRRTGDERWLTVDAGFNTLLEHTNYAWYYGSMVATRAAEPTDGQFRLAGPLCDGGDVFMGDEGSAYRRFPSTTGVGDVILFRDCGAYTLEMMHPYNARPRAAAVAVALDGQIHLIRRRETEDELLLHDLAPGFD